jgi:hypothetical protein
MRLRRTEEATWWATLGGGVVVLAAVGGLLEMLRRSVRDVDRAVADVWTAGKRLAQNTQSAHLLDTTRTRTAALREELERADLREDEG